MITADPPQMLPLTSISNSGGPRMSFRAMWSITIGISGGAAFSEHT